MKKEVTIKFCWEDTSRPVNRKDDRLYFTGLLCTQEYRTTMEQRKLRSTYSVVLLTPDQLEQVLIEGESECETVEEVKNMFTFVVKRYGTYLELIHDTTGVRIVVVQSNTERVMTSRFILSQMIRFGVVDKLKRNN